MQHGDRRPFDPAGAGAILTAATGASVGIGALLGWAAGNLGYGIVGGSCVGLPVGVAAVVQRYRGSL